MKIAITGGAGFIGTALANKLYREGHELTIIDSLSPQIHGLSSDFSPALRLIANCIQKDVRAINAFSDIVENHQIIIHLAAETGTGQSMYQIEDYCSANIGGTARLLDQIVNNKRSTVKRLIVASSRAIYGEGKYTCSDHGIQFPRGRERSNIQQGIFNPICSQCKRELSPLPTDEESQLNPTSIYGVTKLSQEQACHVAARASGIDSFALRFQNVYGPGQSLVNPYTGILAIFSRLAMNRQPLNVFEDGLESRDFVYIEDVVSAIHLCVDAAVHGNYSYNVGSGVAISIREIANLMNKLVSNTAGVNITGQYRVGDIRHNIADLTKFKMDLGFSPQWTIEAGLANFVRWSLEFDHGQDGLKNSLDELAQRGLLVERKL